MYVHYKTNIGGALYFSGATQAEVVRCLFSTNTAGHLNGYPNGYVAGGAAIGAEAGAKVAGSLHVADSQFIGNAAHSSETVPCGIVYVSGALLKAEFERCSFIGSGHSSNSDIKFASRHGDIALAAGALGLTDCLLAQADGSNAVHVVGGTRVIGSAVDLGCYEMDTPHATFILLR